MFLCGCADGPLVAPQPRELNIYAIPLTKEKLVFLPIAGWQDKPQLPPKGVLSLL